MVFISTKARYNHGEELGFIVDRQRHCQEQGLDPHELELSHEEQEKETEVIMNSLVEADTGPDPGEAVLFLRNKDHLKVVLVCWLGTHPQIYF